LKIGLKRDKNSKDTPFRRTKTPYATLLKKHLFIHHNLLKDFLLDCAVGRTRNDNQIRGEMRKRK
jgi:hypothetical protein